MINHLLPLDYRLDILVEDKVIIELNSVDISYSVHFPNNFYLS